MIESALPGRSRAGDFSISIVRLVARLCLTHVSFAREWRAEHLRSQTKPWKNEWALSTWERLRLRCTLDAVVAELYGLAFADLAWILHACDHPAQPLRSDDFTWSLNPKGFWRVDKEKDPELRHTVLTLVAFHDLKQLGIQKFLELNDGEGWMLPKTVRLADYGLGHDERAKEPQPVAERLGPRFLPWQLEQSPEESWEECGRHAERLEKLLGVKREEKAEQASTPGPPKEPTDLFGNPLPTDLFGNVIEPRRRRRKR